MAWYPVHFFAGCSCRWAILPALLLLACSSASSTRARLHCTEKDAALMVKEAECLSNVGWMCRDYPAEDACPYEDACKATVRERCK